MLGCWGDDLRDRAQLSGPFLNRQNNGLLKMIVTPCRLSAPRAAPHLLSVVTPGRAAQPSVTHGRRPGVSPLW